MRIPARHLRAHADDVPGNRNRFDDWEIEQQNRILTTATALFARFGRNGMSMNSFAQAMRLSPTTIRRYFADLDSLFAEILIRHLMAVSNAVGEAPRDRGNPKAARRAAYVAATRDAFSAPTQRHSLLLRERHALPADLLETVEQLRFQIGEMLAGPHAEAALALLDEPTLQSPQIEAMLAALNEAAAVQEAAHPQAEPPAASLPASLQVASRAQQAKPPNARSAHANSPEPRTPVVSRPPPIPPHFWQATAAPVLASA